MVDYNGLGKDWTPPPPQKKMEVFYLLFLNTIYGLNFIYREHIKYAVKYFKKIIKPKLNQTLLV